MPDVREYHLTPTERVPNSHHPLLYYPGLLAGQDLCNARAVYELITSHGWTVHWVYRYGPTQASHYHSQSHECMAVLHGSATIRFGAGDISADLEENTYGELWEHQAVELAVKAGDVFVIPAGVAHKTYRTYPAAEFSLLTPGRGHGIEAHDPGRVLDGIRLDGFTMIGAYPSGSEWDFREGSLDGHAEWSQVYAVPKPSKDPVLGEAIDGLCGRWS